MVQIYILGTHHSFQTGEDISIQDVQAFEKFLKKICRRFRVKAIAEEMSQEALAEAEQNESHCRRVADELSLVHRYCDPDRSARQMLGIRQENEVRLEGFSRDLSEDEIQENILRS